MSERDRYIPGVPCWADTAHPDPEAAAIFYGRLFGWEVHDVMPPGSDDPYFVGRIRGGDVAAIGPVADGAPPVATWNTYIWVDDADEAALGVVKAGGTVLTEPLDVADAGRMAVVADPEGASFCVWQARSHRGSKVVNEHGSVNFNVLATRDLERARAFYGEVFGWDALSLPAGVMWTLPGYGDHLEELMPGVREQSAAMGAPDGFIDVVAAVTPLAAGDAATRAHWSITFAVDDIDAVATAAQELGAELVSGPMDAPWSRLAVLRDPQGAPFVASQFVPANADLSA